VARHPHPTVQGGRSCIPAFVQPTVNRFLKHADKGPSIQIFGSDGTIVGGERGDPVPFSLYRDEAKLDLWGWTDGSFLQEVRTHTLPRGVEHLIDCILDPSRPVVTSGQHARHVIEIMTRCYDAAREGRTVALETTF